MNGINNVTLVGRLTKDVELKKTQNLISYTNFTIAINRYQSNQQEQSADFINCVAWKHSAEFLAQYATKGDLIALTGRINTRSYPTSDGQKRYVTEVIANDVQIASSNRGGERSTNVEEKSQESTEGYFTGVNEQDLPF